MAPLDDLYAALQMSNEQKKAIADSNPYSPAANIFGQLGTTIATAGPQYSLRDKLIYGAISGLFGGALTSLADRRNSNAQAAYTDVVRRSLGGETNIQRPEDLPSSLFSSAQEAGQMALFKRQIAEQAANQEFQRDLQKSAATATLAEVAKNPRRAGEVANAISQVLPSLGGPRASGVQVATTGTAPVTVAGQPQATGLDAKTESLLAKRDAIAARTGDDTLANQLVSKEIAKDEEQTKKFDEYLFTQQEELSKSKQDLDRLSATLQQAGETGTRVPLIYGEFGRDALLGIEGLVSEDARNRSAARGSLQAQSIENALKMAQIAKGTTSDRDMENYLKAEIGLGKLPEQNAEILKRRADALNIAQQKLDFLGAARQQGLSEAEAKKAFSVFDRLVPSMVSDQNGNKTINPERMGFDISTIPDISALSTQNVAELLKMQRSAQPQQAAQPQVTEPAAPARGAGIAQAVDDTAMGVLNAGARFGNSALFGLPKYAVAGIETATNEIADLFGAGAGRTIGENYDRSMGAIQDTMQAQKEAYPITSMVADVSGAVGSPVNKLGAVKKLYDLGKGAAFLSGANAAGMAGRAALSGAQLAMTNDDPNTSTAEALATGAIGSGVLDTAARGVKALAPAAKDTFRKLMGITSTDIREAAKGVSKVDMNQAVQKFDDALDIVTKEHGLSGLQLAKGDETVLQDVVRKAQDSIVGRNAAIDNIISAADSVTTGPIKIDMKQLDAAAQANKITSGDDIMNEGLKVFDRFMEPFKKAGTQPTLADLQRAKKELNTFYKPGETYNDAYTALATDFKNAIENHINGLVKNGKLPDVDLNAIKSINKEEGSLIQLRNSLAKKLPGSMAQDLMTDLRSKFFTTGTTGMFGAGQFGEALAGDAGKASGQIAALLGASKRLGRPIAQSIATGNAAETLMSPGARSGLLAAQQSLTPNVPQPSFDVSTYAPTGGGAMNFLNQAIIPQEAQAMTAETRQPAPQVQTQESQPEPKKTEISLVDDNLIKAVTWQESRGNAKAVSPKGATGLMQIMPETAKEIATELGYEEGEYDLKDPAISQEFGTHYLNKMMRQFGDEGLALAAYNAGPGKVSEWVKKYGDTWDQVISGIKKDILDGKLSRKYYKETLDYVPSILKKRSELIEA